MISRYENGVDPMSLATFLRACSALGANPGAIIERAAVRWHNGDTALETQESRS